MSFGIELLLSDTDVPASLAQTRFRYEVAIARRVLSSGIEELSILSEVLRPIASPDDTWIAKHPEFAEFARYDASEVLLVLGNDLHLSVNMTEKDVDITPEHLRALPEWSLAGHYRRSV